MFRSLMVSALALLSSLGEDLDRFSQRLFDSAPSAESASVDEGGRRLNAKPGRRGGPLVQTAPQADSDAQGGTTLVDPGQGSGRRPTKPGRGAAKPGAEHAHDGEGCERHEGQKGHQGRGHSEGRGRGHAVGDEGPPGHARGHGPPDGRRGPPPKKGEKGERGEKAQRRGPPARRG